MSDSVAEALVTDQSGEGAAAPAEGQVAPPAAEAEPFFRHKWDDDKEDVWHTQDELRDWMRQSGMRHSDYTRKTQQIADQRKTLDQKMKDYEAKERTFNTAYPEIMAKDKFLREHPDIAERIAKEMSGSNSEVENLLQQRLKPFEEKLSKYEQDAQRREAEEARNAAFDAVGTRYPDFNREAINAAIQRMEEVPEAMRLESMVELLYHAEKGRMTPGEIERRKAMAAAKPKGTAPTSNVAIPEQPASPEEEMKVALAAMEAARAS